MFLVCRGDVARMICGVTRIEREVVKLLSYDRTIVFFVNLQYEVVNLLQTAELAS